MGTYIEYSLDPEVTTTMFLPYNGKIKNQSSSTKNPII